MTTTPTAPTPGPTNPASARSGRRPLLRRPLIRVLLAVGAALLVGAVLLFEPWTALVDRPVNEPAPRAATSAAAGPGSAGSSTTESVTLATGEFVSHEHATTGSARLLQMPDGSRVLRLEGLDTSDGPRLQVWLSDAPVIPGLDGWFVFGDSRHLDLGELKGNIGDANYLIPAGADINGLTSVSIWCDRFSVSFGAAALA